MARSTIRPPRRPKGEDPEVTIANNELGIKLLIERVQVLTKERDDSLRHIDGLNDELRQQRSYAASISQECASLRTKLADAGSALNRIHGWQDCAREMIESLTLQKP